MATGQAAKPAPVNDWQNVEPNDWQDVNAAPASTPAPQPGLIQRMKANFNAGTQHAAPPTSLLDMFSPKRAVQNFGASTGDAIRGAYHMFDKQPEQTLDQQYDRAGQQVDAFAKDPVASYVNAAGEAAPGLIAGAGLHDIADAVPRTSRANAKFESLNKDLADLPVPLKSTLDPLQRATELGTRGGTLPKPVSDLLTRSQAVIDPTYPELRDYQSNLSDLSREQQGSLNKKMLSQVGRVNRGVYQDIYDATSGAGRGEDYASAMKEFRQAQQLKDIATKTAKVAIPTAAAAIGARPVASYLKTLF